MLAARDTPTPVLSRVGRFTSEPSELWPPLSISEPTFLLVNCAAVCCELFFSHAFREGEAICFNFLSWLVKHLVGVLAKRSLGEVTGSEMSPGRLLVITFLELKLGCSIPSTINVQWKKRIEIPSPMVAKDFPSYRI